MSSRSSAHPYFWSYFYLYFYILLLLLLFLLLLLLLFLLLLLLPQMYSDAGLLGAMVICDAAQAGKVWLPEYHHVFMAS